MLPKSKNLFPSLIAALLIVLGTLGIYTAEAHTFRSTISDAKGMDQHADLDATDFGDDVSGPLVPGLPY